MVVCLRGAFLLVCLVVLPYMIFPYSTLDLPTISSLRYNDCHYRDDACSNGPKKKGFRFNSNSNSNPCWSLGSTSTVTTAMVKRDET